MPLNCALPQGSGGPFESTSLDTLISKRQVQGATKKGFRFIGRDIHNYIWPRPLCWQSRYAIYAVTNDPTPIALMHPCSMVIILLILHLSICLFLGSGINRKSSIKLTLRSAAAEEGKNNNNNNNPVGNVGSEDHANPPNSWNNSLNSGRGSNIAGGRNINIIGRRGSSDIITSRSSNIAADDSIIISGSLSGRGS